MPTSSKMVYPRNPKLVRREDGPKRVAPSAFTQQMLKSTEEHLADTSEMHLPRIVKLQDMSETTHQKFSSVEVDQALFQPYPSELVFQNFTPPQTYELPLLLRNNDKVPRFVKVEEEASLYFRVVSPRDVCNKVPPGLSSKFTVLFTPHENKDYFHRLVCVTEREKFEVPIRALGPRAIMDIPDQLCLPVCPVRASTQLTQLVHNIGHIQAKFQLHTQRPFSVMPSEGTLGVGESLQVTVDFCPRTVGEHSQDLILHYHTGEDVYITLYGLCEELDVCLEPDSVLLEKTYVSLVSQRTVCLHNSSHVPLHYSWRTLASQQDEQQHTLRECSELQKEEEEEKERFLSEVKADPAECHRLPLLSRTFQERRRQATQDSLLALSHSCITVEPGEGEIWPNTTTKFNIVFKPQEARLYQDTIYCDITGRESRLPLTITGEGMGPKLQFNYNQLDMDNVFIGSNNSYEVLLSNRGLIDAPFRLSCPNSTFGSCFSFSPEEGVVPPGACHALEVSFSASVLGTFSEDLLLTVTGHPGPLILTFRGRVIGPTFNFNVSELNFGDVAFGFPCTLTCLLSNTSLVTMTFSLRVLGDGGGPPSVSSDTQVSELSRNHWLSRAAGDTHTRPVEFTLCPAAGTLRAMSDATVKVTLCSNTVQRYSLALAVDVEGVGEEVMTLPISARCVVPNVVVETPVIEFQRCFLDHPYRHLVRLTNTSTLPACYGLLEQEYEESPSLLFNSAHPRGVIQPCSSLEMPLCVQAKAVGRLQHTARIAMFGQATPRLEVVLSCIGQGPLVHVHPLELDFGKIPVLTDVTRTLQLSNQSPIPARFTAHMGRGRSLWRVDPSEGEVPPVSRLDLRLVAHLNDTLHFKDKLYLAIQHSQTHTIPVAATGTGTTIVPDRPLGPTLDLGTHFSHGPCRYNFRLVNSGQRSHRLYWATGDCPLFPRRDALPSTKTSKKENISVRDSLPSITTSKKGKAPSRRSLVPSTGERPVFSLTPSRVELCPGSSVDMVLEGSSDSPKVVCERLVCNAILGQQGVYERIMSVDVTCRFVAPVLDISHKQLNFYVEKVPGKSLVPLYQKLVLKNVSSLALFMDLSLTEPFSLCDAEGDPASVTTRAMVLGVGVQAELWVRFNPAYRQDRVSRMADESLQVCYREHPQQDMVWLHGEVHFPNLHLSSTCLDFGCVLNHTEAQRELTITNCSPLPVSYRWTFQLDHKHTVWFAGQTEVGAGQPITGQDRDGQLEKMDANFKLDSNRETEVPRLSLEDEEGGTEKRDPENETKEGRGSPKEPLPAPLTPSLQPEAPTTERCPVGVEEVFDILPIYGRLQPGASQLVTFSFYGHAQVSAQVLAQCHVDEGPTYDITLRGEASEVTYSLDTSHINLGLQLFDRVAEAEVTLRNTGKVGFNFSALLPRDEEEVEEQQESHGDGGLDRGQEEEQEKEEEVQEAFPREPRPGQPLIVPNTGFIEAGAEQRLRVLYLPGVPEVFERSFQLQVAFLPAQDVTLTGEGVFPRIYLDLPRPLQEEWYREVVQQAKAAVEADRVREETLSRPATGGRLASEEEEEEAYIATYDGLLQLEIERLLVKANAVSMTNSLLELRGAPGSSSKWRKLSRSLLPEYVLDFGYVIHGEVPTHTVRVTNTGPVAVSFRADRKPLAGTGFSAELDRVRNLPYCETQTFVVKFDPRGANLEMGEVSVVMPIQVTGGPTVQVRLHAIVTMPTLSVSTDTLQFDRVQCGMCQVMTIQLFNQEAVPCQWSIAEEEKPDKKLDKFLPLHLRKALPEPIPPPVVFEMVPSSGLLYPGERVNVQVTFSPAEGRAYSKRLVVCVSQSSQRVLLVAQGRGQEPQLEFCPSKLEMGPVLPFSAGQEAEVTVKNPCPFPIELYSLEFDTQYLEEEKILRLMKGYDEHKVLLLPPRIPGDPLPPELLDYYKELRSQLTDSELRTGPSKEEVCLAKGEGHEEESPNQNADRPQDRKKEESKMSLSPKEGTPCEGTRQGSGRSLGQLEMTPVSRAIARHMGIDLTPEGLAARNRQGIALIVHGAPLTGKSSTAVDLACHYGGACLSMDGVVTEALTAGTSPASLTAKQLYDRAATEYTQKKAEEAAKARDTMGTPATPVPAPVMAPAPGSPSEGTLSVEAVAKHAADGCSDSKFPKKTQSSQQPSLGGQTQLKLREILGQVGHSSLNRLLPEPLLVEILAERLQLSDCHRGVVIDGLESLYTHSVASALQVVLKALHNRKHIYLVNLSNSYSQLKARERAQREAEEALQKEVAERERQRLQEMDEEEYDALPEEEKELLAQRHLQQLRQRKRREQERVLREQEERKQQEEARREEEEMKKRKHKSVKRDSKEDLSGKKSQLGGKQSTVMQDGRNTSKDSSTEASREHVKKEGKEPHEDSPLPTEEMERETSSKGECLLLSRFHAYEQSQPHVVHILLHWDRAQGQLLVPLYTDEGPPEPDEVPPEKQPPAGKRNKKEREKEKVEKEKEKQKADMAEAKLASPAPSQMSQTGEGGDEASPLEVIPHILLPVTGRDYPSTTELLKGSTLPPLEEVLDGLGLGPSGPPIPPPTVFSVVPFPKRRAEPSGQLTCDCFTFLVPSGSDEPSDEKKDAEVEREARASPIKEELVATPSKGRGKKAPMAAKGKDKEEKDKKDRESQKDKRRTSAKRGGKDTSPHPSSDTPLPDSTGESQGQHNQRLTMFRWVVPANGEVTLKIWFHSNSPGKFDQTLNLELLGTRRRYQLFCRGVCTYPSISKDYKTLFALTKKTPRQQEGLHKSYVINPGFYDFGPLLCGKTRDWYKEKMYPENMERLVIHNDSALEAEVHFSFQHDTNASIYILEPPSMTLKPDQKQELTVWAYPTSPGQVEDCVVCCIKDNPEPVIIRLSCQGVRPELELDRKQLQFDKILLHREDRRSVTLRNKTALAVAWRLRGLEELEDGLSPSQTQGIVLPHSSFSLQFHFTPKKELLLKRTIRLEVSDVENILGNVQTENIHVTAEAYNAAVDIILSKATLDFGTVKVSDEVKLPLIFKNRGKYELAYRFILERTEPSQPDLASVFTVTPQQGSLLPKERPSVHVLFKYNKELSLRDQTILRCQVIEPSLGDGGEVIGIIPIRVSVQSYFSRYMITPPGDINFGPLVYGCKKSHSFSIHNKGEFEMRFIISRMKDLPPVSAARQGAPGQGKRLFGESHSGRPPTVGGKVKRIDPIIIQNRLNVGAFTVFPCSGAVWPGCHQVVTVDCGVDQVGRFTECLAVDIIDRDPSDHPDGIPFRLMAEVCMPGIGVDLASVFEEHRLCHSTSLLSSEQFREAEGIYVTDENKFMFTNVLVGHTAQARFKLTNNGKVPCHLSLAIRPVGTKLPRDVEVFDLSPAKLCIPSQSHSFAVVTFTPHSMQLYHAVFEATLDKTPSSMAPMAKNKALGFDLMGEGNLPSVCVVRPALRNSIGNPVLQFRQLLAGRRHTLPLVLRNNGNVPAQVLIDMLDKQGVFTLHAAPGNTSCSIHSKQLEGATGSEHQLAHVASLSLSVGQQAEFAVGFCPNQPLSAKAKMVLQVEGNQYNDIAIQLVAETYQDIISLDNISGEPKEEVSGQEEEEGDYELLQFGDCHVGRPHQESFTMTNHSSSVVLRFDWPPAGPQISFSPQVGHLHAGCSKEVTVTFSCNEPVTLAGQPMRCKLCRVEFQQPLEQVADWDDRHQTVRWMTPSKQAAGEPQQQPAKTKVIMTDPEPCCTVVEGSQRELELRVSAVCDYAKFSCNSDSIHFKDTMLYQTRLYQLQMVNQGNVKLEYSWQVFMDPNSNKGEATPHSSHGRRSGLVAVTAARPSSALASVSSLMLGDPDLPPFSVEPNVGAIVPGATQTFSIRLTPSEVAKFQGRLVCSIPNLQHGDQAPCITVCGRSLLPYCHFHLEDSDYISGNRRSQELRGPHGAQLDPNTRVIEFYSLGLSVPTTRHFSVVNPTSKRYSFQWRCEDSGSCSFRCLTPQGSIQPGKKVEVCLEYVPEKLEVVESFWSFLMPDLSLSVPFLLVGTSRDPVVYLDRAYFHLGSLLLGRRVEQTVYLVNREEQPFHFSVLESSLNSEDQQDRLLLQPMTGKLAPKDRLPVVVSFTPSREGCVSFSLVVKVKGKTEPLVLNVKADGYSISACVQVENADGELKEISPDSAHALNFGKLEVSELSTFTFMVSNPGQFSLEVTFDLAGPRELLRHLEAEPQRSTIEAAKQLQSSLCFCPQSPCLLSDVVLHIKVKHGPAFTFALEGCAVVPGLSFSFTKHNFGRCFLYCTGMDPASQTLVIANKGEKGISVQCQFQNTSYLEVSFQTEMLPPGGTMEVPVTFYPREARRYHEKLNFTINNSAKQVVDILGQGVEMRLEVEETSQRVLNLGAVLRGQRVKRQVALVNHSHTALSFSLLLHTAAQLDPRVLSVSPTGEVTLKPHGGRCKVEIQFSPRHRMPPFTAELQAECVGVLRPLLALKGCCQAAEVQLDQDYLVFGAVVQRSKATKKIVMMNTGDIGARFEWDVKHFPAEVSIAPAKGYVCSGMELPFEVTFAPTELCQHMKYENLPCSIEGTSKPITLTLAGSCIVPHVIKEEVIFTCPVRGSHAQSLSLSNPTSQRWSLKPIIEGKSWSGPLSVAIEPFQSTNYKITYRPMTITTEGIKHTGSVFFSFPDGTGVLYSLQGTAEPPKPEATISHELPAKTHHTELVLVHNWLTKPQRFRAVIEMLKPEKPDATVALKGPEYIDVPALAKKHYKMSFFTYKEGLFNAKVIFLNEASGEYLFYNLSFKATSPGVISTMELVTPVRQTASASVQVENPLATAVCLTAECKCPDVFVPPPRPIPGQSKGALTFEYQPLHVGESTARLSVHGGELGYFHHELLLRALPAPPEKPIYFSTPLGSCHSIHAKFINYSRVKAEYSCKTDCPDFLVAGNVSSPSGFQAGSEVSVEVSFEPCQLGEVRGQLTVSSGVSGEYVFPLHGTCIPPKAQGPFSIRTSSSTSIPFKNVFLENTAFSFMVDKPCFSVKEETRNIRSKKTHNIQVTFEAPPSDSKGPFYGRLSVSSARSQGHGQPWVYYLKGYCPEPGQRERPA